MVSLAAEPARYGRGIYRSDSGFTATRCCTVGIWLEGPLHIRRCSCNIGSIVFGWPVDKSLNPELFSEGPSPYPGLFHDSFWGNVSILFSTTSVSGVSIVKPRICSIVRLLVARLTGWLMLTPRPDISDCDKVSW